jgi:hypothetical protein
MTKVRTRHEDVFIGKTYHIERLALNPGSVPVPVVVREPIPDKYHFYYNPKWVSNQSNTKRIALRKIKAYLLTFVFEVAINYKDNIVQQINDINHVIMH